MAETSRFWDGTATGDASVAPYDAATETAAVLMSLSGAGGVTTNLSGVFRGELNELVATGASTPVAINTGRAISYGTWYQSDASVNVAIPTPSGATRIDRIVLRKDWTLQTVRITRIAGVEGGGAPALVQIAGTTWDEPIVQVSITTGGVITLTDQRQFVGSNLMRNIQSLAVGDLLYADSATSLARLADVAASGSLLASGGIGVAPAWATAPTISGILTALKLAASSGGAVGSAAVQVGEAGTGLYGPGSHAIGFVSNGAELMRLFTTGGLFLGTSAPSDPGVGNIKLTGGAIQGSTTGQNLRLIEQTQMANNAVAQLHPTIAKPNGMIVINFSNDGRSAIFTLTGGNNTIALVADPDSKFSVTPGTASRTNVYYSAGNSRYEVENKTGGQATYEIWFFTSN